MSEGRSGLILFFTAPLRLWRLAAEVPRDEKPYARMLDAGDPTNVTVLAATTFLRALPEEQRTRFGSLAEELLGREPIKEEERLETFRARVESPFEMPTQKAKTALAQKPEQYHTVRRNLLVVAAVVSFVGITRRIPTQVSAFDMSLVGSTDALCVALGLVVAYHLSHFYSIARTSRQEDWDCVTEQFRRLRWATRDLESGGAVATKYWEMLGAPDRARLRSWYRRGHWFVWSRFVGVLVTEAVGYFLEHWLPLLLGILALCSLGYVWELGPYMEVTPELPLCR